MFAPCAVCGLRPLNGHSVVVFRTLDGVCAGIYSHILKDFFTDPKFCEGPRHIVICLAKCT